jgi:uncharacterized membrane protein
LAPCAEFQTARSNALWAVWTVFGFLSQFQELIPEAVRPQGWVVGTLLTIATGFVLAAVISTIGWASRFYLGKKLLEVVAELIQRIPVVRSIYGALDQLLKTLAAGGGQQFSRVVYVEYPRTGAWAIAFVTGPAVLPFTQERHLNVYVPTTPNPTSGFHLIVPENQVRDSGMRVEEAFRVLLSLGIASGPK